MRAHTHTIGMAAVAACAASLMSGLGGVRAANDWSVPCVQGVCSYDVTSPDGNNAATLKIVRPHHIPLSCPRSLISRTRIFVSAFACVSPSAERRLLSGARLAQFRILRPQRGGRSCLATPTAWIRTSVSCACTTMRAASISWKAARRTPSSACPKACVPYLYPPIPHVLLPCTTRPVRASEGRTLTDTMPCDPIVRPDAVRARRAPVDIAGPVATSSRPAEHRQPRQRARGARACPRHELHGHRPLQVSAPRSHADGTLSP